VLQPCNVPGRFNTRASTGALRGLLRQRGLLPDEHTFLALEFGASLDLERVRIAGGGHPLGRIAWQPAAALIQMADVCFEASDPTRSVRREWYPVLAHEALHVWQRVHRHCVVHVSLDGLWLGVVRGRQAYDYDRKLRDPAEVLREFLVGNIERQGQMFEDYVRSHVVDPQARDGRFAQVAHYVRSQIARREAGCGSA
jgi:hypothetical protein